LALDDEIGNFSKRREVKEKSDDRYDDTDDDWSVDWDDDDDDGSEYEDVSFRLYGLDELAKFNEEAEALEAFISPWWRKLKVILTKATFVKIGILNYKKKALLADDTFTGVQIRNREESLEALTVFEGILKRSYRRHFIFNIYGLLSYVPFIYWSGWSAIVYFVIAWSLFDMGLRYFKNEKHKAWLVKAETFIKVQEENALSLEGEERVESRLEEILKFNAHITQDEKEHWSIRLYDVVANLFTRRK